ncbi:transcriptional regulator with XRE-family HTH domain [Kibdelosporangium banguiense]|uniref:Transcriptional regulator with XRE-family HTH domain n=1 Tax=Kibdelosporangium banguiense TaxID=1365924 RepID=A0ABS4TSE9_9PSEU|nr:helix-turn-helix transcriptional regulator [Kibdelosporangium banguiense]MBP2327336.1 transcriptional regulator with XRE-family HTH domain [Kibdelosporangium banguiense]
MEDTDDLSPGSLVRRWRLGKRLRQIREEVGRTMDEAAAYIGVRRPTISRIETGRQAILPKNVKFLCQFYDVGPSDTGLMMRQAEESNERGWWMAYSGTMPDWFENYVGYEADAKAIWTYSSELVPGLLQTQSYLQGLNESLKTKAGALERVLAFRLDRQKRLAARGTDYRVVLNEAVVRRPVGDMREQLRHLLLMADREYISLQILTFESGPHRSMIGPFNMLTLPEEEKPNFVYLEQRDGAVYLERQSDLGKYTATFEALAEQALPVDETRDFLATLVK